MNTPPPYEAIDLDKVRNRSPRISGYQNSKDVRFPATIKVDMSPCHYNPNEKLTRVISPRIFISESKTYDRYLDTVLKSKTNVPAPNTYSPEKGDKFVTIGARRSYK